MSKELKAFYRAMQTWIEEGTPDTTFTDEGVYLCKYVGLCSNLDNYTLVQEMRDQFQATGLDHYYPFNMDHSDYKGEQEKGTLYTNPKRLAWIKEHSA